MTPPPRGFPAAEYADRTRRAQDLMRKAELEALLLTTEPEVRYYTGFLTRFWESPTRPWFVVLPVTGKPIAVIPSIGAHLMGQTWIDDIRTWCAPDYTDDGIGLLTDTLSEVTGTGGRIGLADHIESHVRLPRAALRDLKTRLAPRRLVSDAAVTRTVRLVKSDAEITKIGHAAAIANRAFDRVADIASPARPLVHVFRDFQRLCLEEGADWVPYLAGAAGEGGYGDVISPAGDTPLRAGDVLMLDTGLVWDGYFCDFDRNFSVGHSAPDVRDAHAKLIDASAAAFALAKPGTVIAELFHAMAAICGTDATAGRAGHGLGMQLTEWPSILAADRTVLVPGMVLTIEPSIEVSPGKLMVHEENIVIRDSGAEYLSSPQEPTMRVI